MLFNLLISLVPFLSAVHFFIARKAYNKYIKILENVINANDEFYNFLQNHEFTVDWIGRLYSYQQIPSYFKDYTTDELYDITMRALRSIYTLLEKNTIVDLIMVYISKRDKNGYVVTICPINYFILRKYAICGIINTALLIITFLLLVL